MRKGEYCVLGLSELIGRAAEVRQALGAKAFLATKQRFTGYFI